METKDLVQSAQERKYTEFDKMTKEILAIKVAEKMQEQGYFDRLDHAKGETINKIDEEVEAEVEGESKED